MATLCKLAAMHQLPQRILSEGTDVFARTRFLTGETCTCYEIREKRMQEDSDDNSM